MPNFKNDISVFGVCIALYSEKGDAIFILLAIFGSSTHRL